MNKELTKKLVATLMVLVLILNTNLKGQDSIKEVIGKYSDHKKSPTTILNLKSDGTFYLKELDNIFFMRPESFENEGKWILINDTIILNPHLTKFNKDIELVEESIEESDSVRIELNYFITEIDQTDSFSVYEFLLTTYE